MEKLYDLVMYKFARSEAVLDGESSTLWNGIFNYAVDKLHPHGLDGEAARYSSTIALLMECHEIWEGRTFGTQQRKCCNGCVARLGCSWLRKYGDPDQLLFLKPVVALWWKAITVHLWLVITTLSCPAWRSWFSASSNWGRGFIMLTVSLKRSLSTSWKGARRRWQVF